MRCRYCFYAGVSNMRSVPDYGMMTHDTARTIIAHIYADLQDGDKITFAFQGGEPTLAGLPFFEFFVSEVQKYPVKVQASYVLQTNGLRLDDTWLVFLKKHRFLVGLSLDGYAAIHNQNRLDSSNADTFNRVLQSKRLLDQYGVDYNVLSVLTNEMVRHVRKVWEFILKENIRYMQFIPCLGDLNGQRNAWQLRPRKFYSFYTNVFPLWKEQAQKGNWLSIKLYDDIIALFGFGKAVSCGINGRCHPQFVVEADGSVFPCDFYVLDQYRTGNLQEITLREAYNRSLSGAFHQNWPALPPVCGNCPYRPCCNGGCRRLQPAMYLAPDGFCGFRALLDDRLQELRGLGAG